MKIIDYTLLEAFTDLEDPVCEHIKQGWQPFGSPFIHNEYAYQAMVKYETEKPQGSLEE